MQKVFYLFFILIYTTVLYSQKDTLIRYYDNSDVQIRSISDNSLTSYKNDSDFDYRKEITEPENYFAKIINKIINFFFGDNSVLSRVIKYTIAALFFMFIILRLTGLSVNKLFYKNKFIENIVPIEENIDNIKDVDIDLIINNAKKNNDYKTAIRYLFIKALKLLSLKEIIYWQINKTNRDYYYEISDNNIKEQFIKLSQIFSYVWYGNFEIDNEKFIEFDQNFSNFFSELQ